MKAKTLARQLLTIASQIDDEPKAAAGALITLAAELDPASVTPDTPFPSDTVSLRYAWTNLCRESFLPGVRVPIVHLTYQGMPIGAISNTLILIIQKDGAKIPATPLTRIERTYK